MEAMRFNGLNYPHVFKRQVFLYETDAFGHTNNVTYFQFMESARFELFKEMRLFDPTDILTCPLILAHAECDYRQISRYDDTLLIYSRVSDIRKSSFLIENVMFREATGDVIATGKVTLVYYHHRKNKAQPLPEKVKKALQAYTG